MQQAQHMLYESVEAERIETFPSFSGNIQTMESVFIGKETESSKALGPPLPGGISGDNSWLSSFAYAVKSVKICFKYFFLSEYGIVSLNK